MTTAHRPTYHPAVGRANQGGYHRAEPSRNVSVYSMAAHTNLKYREFGQGSAEEVNHRDLKAELEIRERVHFGQSRPATSTIMPVDTHLKMLQEEEDKRQPAAPEYDDADEVLSEEEESSSADSDDAEDDDELLRLELERIKSEKELEKKQRVSIGTRSVLSMLILGCGW